MILRNRRTRLGEHPQASAHAGGSTHEAEAQCFDVPSNGVTIAVRAYPGSGDVVLLLHGGPGCPGYLQPVAQALSGRLRGVTFDQRGVGHSAAAGSFAIEDYLADIEEVRRSLGVEQIHLLGHSWGGLLAQLYASRYPERVSSMVLANSAAGVGRQWRQVEREVLTYNRNRSGLAGFIALGFWAALTPLPGRVGHGAARRLFARVWRNYFPDDASAPPADANWLNGVSGSAATKTTAALRAADHRMLHLLGSRLQAPVLVLYGERDIYGAKSGGILRERFPDARHVTLANCGHLPWLQAADTFGPLLLDFYSTAAPPRLAPLERAALNRGGE